MSEETETGIKEVSIVKKFSTPDSENYVSVSVRSSKDTISELLSKAVRATSTNSQTSVDKKLGIQ
jgi:hypothetical protein